MLFTPMAEAVKLQPPVFLKDEWTGRLPQNPAAVSALPRPIHLLMNSAEANGPPLTIRPRRGVVPGDRNDDEVNGRLTQREPSSNLAR